jgi:DNA-binding beta-propeller fold protein YncE
VVSIIQEAFMRRILCLMFLGFLGFLQINCGPKAPSSPVVTGADTSYSFITNFGQYGNYSSPSQIEYMGGMAVSGDKIYVSDWDYATIETYDLAGNYLNYFYIIEPDFDDYIYYNYGMAADKYQHLYLTNAEDDEIDVFNTAQFPTTVSGGAVTAAQYYPTGCGPSAVAVDQNGLLYVADYCDRDIYTIAQLGSNPGGGLYTSDGSVSINGGSFANDGPNGIAVAPDGSKVYVADTGNNVVQVYDSGLTWIGVIGDVAGASGTVTGKFDNPEGLAIDNDGNLLVADQDNARIQKFSPSGAYLASFGNTANNISAGQLESPLQIGLDASNNVYVADNNYNTIFKYATGN